MANRSYHNRRDDKDPNISIGLIDHDEAIQYYIDNVIKLKVEENGGLINVPTIYSSPERWKTVKRDGFYRDKTGQVITPLVMFRKTNIEKLRDYPKNLDANNPQLFISQAQQYTSRNKYDKFSILNNVIPQVEFQRVIVPTYIRVTYQATIWTNYVTQMNSIIESFQYAEDSYWGDFSKYRFYTKIDNFSEAIEIEVQKDRSVRSDFDIMLNGYIIPESLQLKLKEASQKSFSASKLRFTEKLS